ncbi:MAG: hypothetical protein CSB47_01665 [Proteobacteria bacterium]|nr:MAG: hypothetical protein CSB47_01665 [Pseudomonadota bacterium]
MSQMTHFVEVLIIGAGMAGLAAASDLHSAGKTVLVIDKTQALGGRLAYQQMGEAIAEYGAQFVTARSDRFQALLESWQARGLMEVWFHSGEESGEEYPHYRGVPTMNVMAQQLAMGLDYTLGKCATSVTLSGNGWLTTLESGEQICSEAIVITSPIPQTLALLEAGHIAMTANDKALLTSIEYDPCITVIATLHSEPEIPAPGGLAMTVGPIAWLADNQQKGVSAEPSVTLQASVEYSRKNWERDRREVGQELLTVAEHLLGASVVDFQVHAWRYSKPKTMSEQPYLTISDVPKMVLAGDAFGGPRVEGAVLSGWAAAEAIQG